MPTIVVLFWLPLFLSPNRWNLWL